jgi:hypothetical protein
MSSASGEESVITIDGDYNHTNDFIVRDINSDGVVARQLYKQLKAPSKSGSKRVQVPSAKVREYRQDKKVSGDKD